MTNEKLFDMTDDELWNCLEEIGVYYDGTSFFNQRAYNAELERNMYKARLQTIRVETERALKGDNDE